MSKHYHDKKKNLTKADTVDAGKGKLRPHHKQAIRKARKSLAKDGKLGDDSTAKHRLANAEIDRLHRTPNKYQTEARKVYETPTATTYQWFEDNGHEDHVQMRRTSIIKDEDRIAKTFHSPASKKYQQNYEEIFGEKERGVAVGHKTFKKTYK